jgi:hypothetical protein
LGWRATRKEEEFFVDRRAVMELNEEGSCDDEERMVNLTMGGWGIRW